MTSSVVTLPQEAKQNPITFLEELSVSVAEVTDTDIIKKRLALIAAAQAWAKQYGQQAEPVLRHALVTRLIHERRLGELLDGSTEVLRGNFGRLEGRGPLPSGITKKTSMYAQTLAKVPRGWFDDVIKGILDGARRLAIKEIYLQARRMAAKPDSKIEPPDNLIIGDFREVGSHIARESASLIFTDPPYDRRNSPLYESLAEFASRVLLPGGSLLVYAPHYSLPEVLSSMAGKLRYFWTIAVIHQGGKALMREYGIRVWFKPILWYVKGDRYNKQRIIRDVIESSQEKLEHEWQQSVIEARFAIENLTDPGDLVIDPLAGSGTTLIAAETCNRRWLGIEQDSKTAELATERLKLFLERLASANS